MFIMVEDKNKYSMIAIMENVRYDPTNDILYLQLQGTHMILKIDRNNLDIKKMEHEYYMSAMDMYTYKPEHEPAPAHVLYSFICNNIYTKQEYTKIYLKSEDDLK